VLSPVPYRDLVRDPVGHFAVGPSWLYAYSVTPDQPRPMNGILVAMMVMNWTFTSRGRLAISRTARAT